MIVKKKKLLPIAYLLLCSVMTVLFVYDPAESAHQLKLGLSLCAEVLIPTLFPFMVISEVMVRSELASYIAPIAEKPMRVLFNISGRGATALILGILCGFPVGGKTAAGLYEQADISREEAERLMPLCNLPSAPFMIFTVGERLFGNRALGSFLYLNTLAVTLLCGVLLSRMGGKAQGGSELCERLRSTGASSPIRVLTDSIAAAASTVIKVCAFVTFFSCAVGSLGDLLSPLGETAKALLFSFFELTSGAAACSRLRPTALAAVLASAAAGWSGISVFLQLCALSRTKRGDISMRYYLAAKLTAGMICPLTAAIAIRLCPSLLNAAAQDTAAFIGLPRHSIGMIRATDAVFVISFLIYLGKKLDRRSNI